MNWNWIWNRLAHDTLVHRRLSGLFAISLLLTQAATSFGQATSPDKFKLPEGFQAKLIYTVPAEQGSWVSLTSDPRGRLIACDQYGSLYRVTLRAGEPDIEPIEIGVGNAQGLLCAFDSLYVMSSGNDGKNGQPSCRPGFYRVRDTDGDDQYDDVQFLRKIVGQGEHGPHAIVLGPDGKSIYICAGNMTRLPDIEASRQPPVWQEDQVIKRYPDARGHASNIMAPGGWICKTDPEGKTFEMVTSGFRNAYDIAFDPNGELFTYDSDMEWDVGLPWYRPTRVCHAVSGAEFGWRNGSGKWPTYYPDSVPPVLEIGPGSPTGVTFGTGAKFPGNYQRAFFISDWSYGVIYAVHLQPKGATYTAEREIFCTAPALPVTDLVINPVDQALYFAIGGRRSQSALYRISYVGDESTAAVSYPELNAAAKRRRELELGHQASPPISLDQVIESLNSPDRAIRYAARIALENQPSATWKDRIAAAPLQAKLEMVLALIRTDATQQAEAVAVLSGLDYRSLSRMQRLHLLRDFGLVLCRQGDVTDTTRAAIQQLENQFPADDRTENLELGKLLVAVDSPAATGKLVDLLKQPGSQEVQIGYALVLASARTGWTIPAREAYFQWFLDVANARGGNSFDGYISKIREDAIASLTESESNALAQLLARRPDPVDPYAALKARPFVRAWKMEDLLPIEETEFANRDLEKGKQLFAIATCYKCHRIQGDGGIVGPDLTAAGRRFNTRDMLETIIDPSKAISDQYQAHVFQMDDGRLITGRVVNLTGNEYMVQPDMVEPNSLTRIKVDQIEEMMPSSVSPMPASLLDNLTRDEILDLLAYLKSTADMDAVAR